ncbi:hypothetical protein CL1_0941 [Thermococcus cleftensis]|uniref:GmrSD restriction endonucleases N-terminal domain-containing protein n=1 Tax=Thermococcus cleftensis (strain DSM 27260 / KACC 17922 / CL1) TaxID=163003 RepID=I3ZTW1_THECF|nr:DUF262 domain-containing protein [Thermococcus cleftensis]AFL95145.1 hypothetical protein CL1_0941 [Thermococcus cleftensis]
MEARNRSIKDWFTKIRTRQLVLPRFQRFEAWGPKEISELLTSIIRDLPVGSALVLGVGDRVPFVYRPLTSAPEEGESINELLLDGQQRLTALWRSLKDNYPDKTYFVKVPGEYNSVDEIPKDEFQVIYVSRWVRNGKRYPMWIENPEECWKKRLIPVRLLDPELRESEYHEWAEKATDGDAKKMLKLVSLISKIREQVAHYNLPYLYLPPETPPEVAIEVFLKLNTNMAPLKPFDIVVAQLEGATGESLHELIGSLKREVPRISEYVDVPTFVLSVVALLQNKPPNQRGFFSIDFQRFEDDWRKVVRGTKLLVQFLEEEGIPDRQRLPTESPLPVIAAIWGEAPDIGNEGGNVRITLREYLWRAFFTERYDRAVPTAMLQDYRGLKAMLINGEGDESNVPIFNENSYPLPPEEVIQTARWPKYRDRLGRAILLISFRGGAEDISDGSRITPQNIKLREYHHVYPVAWLRDNGIKEEDAYRAVNCIMITWKTNRKIGAKPPLEYLTEISDAITLGESELRRRLMTHYVDYDLLASENYEKFIEQRAKDIAKAMQELSKGKAWRP